MYLDVPGQAFGAGHASAGVTAPATEWLLAEGATGSFFDLFVLIANPSSTAAEVEATYLLPDGTTIVKPYTVPANSRFNIWVDYEDARLADTAVSTTVRAANGVPIIVERAMWWPGPRRRLVRGAQLGGSDGDRHDVGAGRGRGGRHAPPGDLHPDRQHVGVAGAREGDAAVRGRHDGRQKCRASGTAASTCRWAPYFPAAAGKRFGAIVESLGDTPAQLVVERATYRDAGERAGRPAPTRWRRSSSDPAQDVARVAGAVPWATPSAAASPSTVPGGTTAPDARALVTDPATQTVWTLHPSSVWRTSAAGSVEFEVPARSSLLEIARGADGAVFVLTGVRPGPSQRTERMPRRQIGAGMPVRRRPGAAGRFNRPMSLAMSGGALLVGDAQAGATFSYPAGAVARRGSLGGRREALARSPRRRGTRERRAALVSGERRASPDRPGRGHVLVPRGRGGAARVPGRSPGGPRPVAPAPGYARASSRARQRRAPRKPNCRGRGDVLVPRGRGGAARVPGRSPGGSRPVAPAPGYARASSRARQRRAPRKPNCPGRGDGRPATDGTRAAPPRPPSSFSAPAIVEHVKVLASDEFEGRAPGSKGEQLIDRPIPDRTVQGPRPRAGQHRRHLGLRPEPGPGTARRCPGSPRAGRARGECPGLSPPMIRSRIARDQPRRCPWAATASIGGSSSTSITCRSGSLPPLPASSSASSTASSRRTMPASRRAERVARTGRRPSTGGSGTRCARRSRGGARAPRHRGLINARRFKGVAEYLLAPFVVGFFERQLPTLTPDFEREVHQYFDEGSARRWPRRRRRRCARCR